MENKRWSGAFNNEQIGHIVKDWKTTSRFR